MANINGVVKEVDVLGVVDTEEAKGFVQHMAVGYIKAVGTPSNNMAMEIRAHHLFKAEIIIWVVTMLPLLPWEGMSIIPHIQTQ